MVLQNLDPETPYNIKVTAMYAEGAGGELEGDGLTCKNFSIYGFELIQRSFKDRKLSILTDMY